jgi:hypothetical protein
MLAKDTIIDLCRRWADAEVQGDAATLDQLAIDGFLLVGPAGFILERPAWLSRFGPEALTMEALRWEPDHVREHGESAVVVGVQTQQATYAGNRADGRFRVTHVVVARPDGPRLAAIQYSPLGGPGPFHAASA